MVAWERTEKSVDSEISYLFESDIIIKHHKKSSSISKPALAITTTKACAGEMNFQLSVMNCSFTSEHYVSDQHLYTTPFFSTVTKLDLNMYFQPAASSTICRDVK